MQGARQPKPIERGDTTTNTIAVETKILAILALVAIAFLVHVSPTTHSPDWAG
jgi:hypothetical protein